MKVERSELDGASIIQPRFFEQRPCSITNAKPAIAPRTGPGVWSDSDSAAEESVREPIVSAKDAALPRPADIPPER